MTDVVTGYGERLGIVSEPDPDGGAILRIPFHRGLVGRPERVHGGAIGALLEHAVRQAVSVATGLETAIRALHDDGRFPAQRHGA